ncbi:putative 26S proteasome regulatory non-ATPase subunit [Trypanosoma theileri]|uniref:Putative 26S proteasome regulatory non-ATPase subunit n=1 Tax=Trypanosoma theileri TaxID=67003 RepID=A0A1X0NZE4_9TRYP|nr:putative 26S proteasome regulatory non-ATPase subunit [Trypanosoma theileri]ORC90064.1 putative 26S proteasome regulatory non-ATPase subunit [Trypanosoma theileri]
MSDEKNAVTIPVLSEDPKERKENEKRFRDTEPLKMSEEDALIKSQVELLINRAGDSNTALAFTAVEQLIDLLRTHTGGSVASVPKPLKYVRAMYGQLEKILKETKDPSLAVRLHDVLSFVAMTIEFPDGRRGALEHKLQGTRDDLAQWGHEYLRFLAGSISAEWKERTSKAEGVNDLTDFVKQIVSYMVTHQDEPTAVDLLMEVEDINAILPLAESHNHRRIANYLAAVSKYLTRPMDTAALRVVYDIYVKMESYTEAIMIALRLGDRALAKNLFEKCQNPAMRLQMALSCGRYRLFIEIDNEEEDLLNEAMGNMQLSQLYRQVAQDLDAMAPKTPEDAFKTGLDGKEVINSSDSSFKLVCSFASGLLNCGFGKDTYLTEKSPSWPYELTENRLIATTAMLGLIHLWDHAEGLQEIDKYLYAEATNIRAGACLAVGVAMCGVTNPFDPALGLLSEKVNAPQKEVKIGAILGLGYAYSGTQKEEIKELLIPTLADSEQVLEVQCLTAFALAMVFVGSTDEDLAETMLNTLMEIPEENLKDPVVSYLILALGCLFLGKQEAADTLLDATHALSPIIRRYTEIVVCSCAYAATGNVVVIQNFFHAIAENEDPDEITEEGATEEKKHDTTANITPMNHKAAAVLGIALVALGEDIGVEMAKRSIIHALLVDTVNKGPANMSGRYAIPLAYALLSASNPSMPVVETLNRLSHDSDIPTAINAILAMGIVSAGSNNARVASKLRNLASYYHKDRFAHQLFSVRLAQSFTMMGKGHLTLSPLQNDRALVSPTALMGLLGFLHSALQYEKTILGKYHYMLLTIAPSISPRMVLPVDSKLEVVKDGVQVRVGLPVDTVAVAGKPKTITGFQTLSTPVLLNATDKVEMASGKYHAVAAVVEGVFVVEEKPNVE